MQGHPARGQPSSQAVFLMSDNNIIPAKKRIARVSIDARENRGCSTREYLVVVAARVVWFSSMFSLKSFSRPYVQADAGQRP